MSQDNFSRKQSYKVFLHPSGWQFNAAEDMSLLNAALQANIRLPSSCRNGICRTCLCVLKSGQVRYQIDWPGLTREEKSDGYLLPCVAVAMSDVVIEVADVVLIK